MHVRPSTPAPHSLPASPSASTSTGSNDSPSDRRAHQPPPLPRWQQLPLSTPPGHAPPPEPMHTATSHLIRTDEQSAPTAGWPTGHGASSIATVQHARLETAAARACEGECRQPPGAADRSPPSHATHGADAAAGHAHAEMQLPSRAAVPHRAVPASAGVAVGGDAVHATPGVLPRPEFLPSDTADTMQRAARAPDGALLSAQMHEWHAPQREFAFDRVWDTRSGEQPSDADTAAAASAHRDWFAGAWSGEVGASRGRGGRAAPSGVAGGAQPVPAQRAAPLGSREKREHAVHGGTPAPGGGGGASGGGASGATAGHAGGDASFQHGRAALEAGVLLDAELLQRRVRHSSCVRDQMRLWRCAPASHELIINLSSARHACTQTTGTSPPGLLKSRRTVVHDPRMGSFDREDCPRLEANSPD